MTGWQCPGCRACYAPSVSECHRCAPQTTVTLPTGGTVPYWPPYVPIQVSPTIAPWPTQAPVIVWSSDQVGAGV